MNQLDENGTFIDKKVHVRAKDEVMVDYKRRSRFHGCITKTDCFCCDSYDSIS